MSYTITIENINYKQLHELTNKLATFGRGLAASGIGEDGKEWRIKVATGAFYTKQVFNALTTVLAQSVTIPYYTIDQLSSDVQKNVCQEAIDANYYWDVWQKECEASFNAICNQLNLQWDCDSYDKYHIDENSSDFYAYEIQGASRVIAYLVNHWGDFKAPMYVDKNKRTTFYKLLNKRGAALPKKLLEDKLLTGYCTDYCFYEAYRAFVNYARQHPDTVTLLDFCDCLAEAFTKEYEADYEQAHSIDYAMEYLCNDRYYTWQGEDITDIVSKQLIGK